MSSLHPEALSPPCPCLLGMSLRNPSPFPEGEGGQPPRLVRLSLGVSLQAVVRNGLPGSGVGDVGAPARPHTGIAVEGPHAHAHLRRIVRVAAEQLRPALAAKALLEAALR